MKKISQVSCWYSIWGCESEESSTILKVVILLCTVFDVIYDGICEIVHENM